MLSINIFRLDSQRSQEKTADEFSIRARFISKAGAGREFQFIAGAGIGLRFFR
jgi:hypothetical protein